MRGLLMMMVVAIACSGSLMAAHGQAGGDEPGGKPEMSAPAPTRPHIPRISSGVMAGLLKTKVDPAYPIGAQGDAVVVLHAIIGTDGHVKTLEAVQGPEVFREAAIEAVRQWTYNVYFLNGEPSEVDTNVIINFHR